VRPLTVLLALAAGLGLAACSSPTASVRTTQPPATTSSTAPSTTSTSSGLAHCLAADLQGSVLGSQGAAGTIELTIGLRNTTSAPCGLEGYPGGQLYSASGAALPTTVVRGGSHGFDNFPPAPVTIAPGATAYFNLEYSDVPTNNTSCPAATSLWVTPPDDTDHLTVAVQAEACNNGTLAVSPVFGAGSPATQTTAPPQG